MKNRKCPLRKNCLEYSDGYCDGCYMGESIMKIYTKVDKLKTENKKLKAENEELKARIDVLLHPSF